MNPLDRLMSIFGKSTNESELDDNHGPRSGTETTHQNTHSVSKPEKSNHEGRLDTSKPEAASRIADLLRDLGFDADSVRRSYEQYYNCELEESKTIEDYILDEDETFYNVREGEPVPVYNTVHTFLRLSTRGVFSDWKYPEDVPQKSLSAVLENYGYKIRFYANSGERVGWWGPDQSYYLDDGESFRIELLDRDDERVDSFEFAYPDTKYGHNRFDLVVDEINEYLLADLPFRFYELADTGDNYSFLLLESEIIEHLENKYGEDVSIAGKTLISEFA
ncbi:hypothetical protein [Haloarcula argentinensis]|uniref:Uncharacterized protein n=1 Tax=Haloarcula argentinensis TaxID=43776 RepID=A0A830FHR3_HALAR|nr:hypothetical protein [Haloarcula argentinensis]MDS0255591.1 hypothetical protein [Haloarcula argentinensis]GGM47857.1 hypothetical protein GCM10009006_31300 [Haloarcula argentinensis]